MTALCALALLLTRAVLAEPPMAGASSLMKAIVHHEYGAPDVLRLEEVEKPVPSDSQVLIRVRAAAVNPLDWHYMRGTPYLIRIMVPSLFQPTVTRLGVDVAGEVEAIGKNVTHFKPGDAVFGTGLGAFAEYVCAGEKSLVLKPANITFDEAAAVPIAAVTALQGLRDKGRIHRGQKVLINGASGGVGTFAVQIAKSFGADVTGVCSTRNMDMVRSLGADHVIDYTKEDFTESGQQYDLILDMVGSHTLSEYRRAMTPKGIFVLAGSTNPGIWLRVVVGMVKTDVYSRFVSQSFVKFFAEVNQEDMTILSDLMRDGKVRSVIDRRYGLHEVPDAIRYLEQGHARGKVVIALEHDGETSPVSAHPASVNTIGARLLVLALVALAIGVPIIGAIALNRRFSLRNPGKRPYRWAYYVSLQSLICGMGLGILLESGALVLVTCIAIYAVLAWFFAQRRRWAWITLTLVVWIINLLYFRKRWAEDGVASPAI
jgi:NADPH:quinone reductase-like Zn-dependent oxidoreductase